MKHPRTVAILWLFLTFVAIAACKPKSTGAAGELSGYSSTKECTSEKTRPIHCYTCKKVNILF